jgi:large subunit ribosomal protein L21
MFAVIKTGGKQYRVAADDKLRVARIEGEVGDIVQLGDVLMVGGDTPTFGSPLVAGASVAVEVVEHGRGEKVIAFKKRRRKNSRRKRGYRDEFTLIRISEILTDGQAPSKKAEPRPKPAPKKAPAAEDDDAPEAKASKKPKVKAKAPAAKKPARMKPDGKGGNKGKPKSE